MSPCIRAVTEQSTPYILGYPMGTVYDIGGLLIESLNKFTQLI